MATIEKIRPKRFTRTEFGRKDQAKAARRENQKAVPLPCNTILRIAHHDARRAYGDLSGYKIILSLEPDGWHVDYDLTAPLLAGGGPHYVIDPSDGRILSKRYDQ